MSVSRASQVGRTLEKMMKRLSQTLQVVVGIKGELDRTVTSVRQRLADNPSLTQDPMGKEAMAAAEAAVSEVAPRLGHTRSRPRRFDSQYGRARR